MLGRSFRFLHAAEFQLDTPTGGLAEWPPHLRDDLIDAPYHAARRVFDTAIEESVDFVLLCGDLLSVRRASPRAFTFLLDQFDRLGEHDIAVYWAAGPGDAPSRWPPALELPEHVVLFGEAEVEHTVHQREGEPVAQILGASGRPAKHHKAADFRPGEEHLPAIAAAHRGFAARAMAAAGNDFWALGGRNRRSTLRRGGMLAHDPGSPQGRGPDDIGPRGCTLVEVDEENRFASRFIATDHVRWHRETLDLEAIDDRGELERQMAGRISLALEEAAPRPVLLSWNLTGQGPLTQSLRRGELRQQILDWLRSSFGAGGQAAWSTGLDTEPPRRQPSRYYEEDTFLGDFLRSARQYRKEPEELQLESLLPEGAAESLQTELGLPASREDKTRLLHEAADLAVRLLGHEATNANRTAALNNAGGA